MIMTMMTSMSRNSFILGTWQMVCCYGKLWQILCLTAMLLFCLMKLTRELLPLTSLWGSWKRWTVVTLDNAMFFPNLGKNINLMIAKHGNGWLRQYAFCLRLSCATFVARTARIKQRLCTTRHSNILIVATTVIGFWNLFKNPTTVFVLCATVVKMLCTWFRRHKAWCRHDVSKSHTTVVRKNCTV